jgi:hypothetical protein
MRQRLRENKMHNRFLCRIFLSVYFIEKTPNDTWSGIPVFLIQTLFLESWIVC